MTLTYDEDNLPVGQKALKRSLQLYIKRLRKALHPRKIRYFFALEYGRLGRAHFHGIIFNASRFDTQTNQKAWAQGFTQVGEVNSKTINYVCKYITKGDSRAKEESGRKTFAVMSRGGYGKGLGFRAIQITGGKMRHQLENHRDISQECHSVRIQGRKLPLGRYLTGKLRLAAGNASAGERPDLRHTRLSQAQDSIRRLGTIEYVRGDLARRTNSLNSAEAKIAIANSKEKL